MPSIHKRRPSPSRSDSSTVSLTHSRSVRRGGKRPKANKWLAYLTAFRSRFGRVFPHSVKHYNAGSITSLQTQIAAYYYRKGYSASRIPESGVRSMIKGRKQRSHRKRTGGDGGHTKSGGLFGRCISARFVTERISQRLNAFLAQQTVLPNPIKIFADQMRKDYQNDSCVKSNPLLQQKFNELMNALDNKANDQTITGNLMVTAQNIDGLKAENHELAQLDSQIRSLRF